MQVEGDGIELGAVVAVGDFLVVIGGCTEQLTFGVPAIVDARTCAVGEAFQLTTGLSIEGKALATRAYDAGQEPIPIIVPLGGMAFGRLAYVRLRFANRT